jgi:hypothetical protein
MPAVKGTVSQNKFQQNFTELGLTKNMAGFGFFWGSNDFIVQKVYFVQLKVPSGQIGSA